MKNGFQIETMWMNISLGETQMEEIRQKKDETNRVEKEGT